MTVKIVPRLMKEEIVYVQEFRKFVTVKKTLKEMIEVIV